MALERLQKDFYVPSTPIPGAPITPRFDLFYDKVKGEVIVKESGNIINPAIIYKNGTFYGDAFRIPELSTNGSSANTQKSINLDQQIKTKIRAASITSKGVLPQFAKLQNQNNSPGSSNNFPGTNPGIATAIPGGGLLSAAPGSGYKDLQNIKYIIDREKEVIGGTTKYPEDLDIAQDTLVITQYNYRAPSGESFLSGNPAEIYKKGLQRNSALLGNPVGTVILPIPSGIKDSNNVTWGPDTMNDMTAAVTSKFMQGDLLSNAGAVYGPGLLANLLPGNIASKIPQDALRNISTLIYAIGPDGLNNPNIRAALDSMMMGAGGFEVSPETILAKGFGIVPNSNMELLFTGPTLRSFQFGYRMSPRNQGEAKNVRKIIRFFKQGMAPRKINSGGSPAGTRSLFLSTPNVFKLEYKTNNKMIRGLNKFKICALTGCAVDYAPDGSWASYEDSSSPGQPVSMSVGLSFQEIEPVYANDYQENITSGLGNDLVKISDDDVGY